jgi:hypothetical protein
MGFFATGHAIRDGVGFTFPTIARFVDCGGVSLALDFAGALLNDMGQFVGEEVAAGARVRFVATGAKEDVTAGSESFGI